MEIILKQDVENLGFVDDIVSVKNGYGRNFLLKKGKALRANKENIDFVKKKKDELNKKNTEIKLKFKEIAGKINNQKIKFNKESKENGDLYGSIKPKEVSSAFLKQLKVEINPSQIDLKQELNKIGKYNISVNLHSEVTANVIINIEKTDAI